MRRQARVDNNHGEIKRAYRELGYTVADTSRMGGGFPDLVVSGTNRATGEAFNLLVEVKDGRKPPSARKLTEEEAKFHATWQGPLVVVASVEEALAAVGIE